MTAWEVEIEMRVRRTLRFAGPETKDVALEIVTAMLAGGDISSLQAYRCIDGYKQVAVETIIDNAPAIVAVRQFAE